MSAKAKENGLSSPLATEWTTDRFDSFCVLQRGFDITKKDQREGSIPVVSSGGISSYHDEAKVRGPGVVIGRKGTLGTVHYIDRDYWPHDTTLWVKDFKGNDPRFTSYLLQSLKLKRFDTGAANPTLNRNLVHGEEVTLPPLPEQKRIAHILSTVQRAIEAQERIIQTTTELKKALMHKLFTEGTRGEKQKESEIGPIPKSWEVVTVGDLVEVKGGKRLPQGEKLVEGDTGLPYIRVTDFHEFSVDTSGLLYLTPTAQGQIARYIVNRDDVYISIAGSIGITGMIPDVLHGANLTENAARLVVNNQNQLHPRFLMYWLASRHCQAEIKAQTVKNAQPKLALARIKSLAIPLPSLDEQREVAEALNIAERKAEVARSKRTQLQDLFRTFLHEMMTAKIRVHDLRNLL